MSEYITHSRAETVALGKRMAAVLAPGALIAFTGGLGAGKTAFTEGLAEGLGCDGLLPCTAAPDGLRRRQHGRSVNPPPLTPR